MTDQILAELESLTEEMDQFLKDKNPTDQLLLQPLEDNIIADLVQKNQTQVRLIKENKIGWFQAFKKSFVAAYDWYEDVTWELDQLVPSALILFILGMIELIFLCSGYYRLFHGQVTPWLLIPTHLPILAWIISAIAVKASRKKVIRQEVRAAYDKLDHQIERLRSEPAFLIENIQSYLRGIAQTYQDKLDRIQISLKRIFTEPRQEARDNLSRVEAHHRRIRTDGKQHLGGLKERLETEIRRYREFVSSGPSEREQRLMQLFQKAESAIDGFRNEINGLDVIRGTCQEDEGIMADLEKLIPSSETEVIRQRFMDDIEDRLVRLIESVGTARKELGGFTDALQLPAGPESIEQIDNSRPLQISA